MGPLVRQLRFAPPQALLEQSYRAERLARLVDPTREYPADFVCFKITEYRPKGLPAQTMKGEALLADLARFIREVSEQAIVGADQLPEEAMAVDALAGETDVSVKTLQRWSRFGLAQRMVSGGDGRKVRVILRGTWEWFIGRHEKLVSRAAAFSRLTVGQRRRVVHEARRLFVEERLSRHQIERRLAERMGRAPETIRYILKRHEATAEPDQRIFPARRPISQDDRDRIWQMFLRGIPVQQLAHIHGRSESSVYRIVHEARQAYWFGRSIDYMYSPEFDVPGAGETIFGAVEEQIDTQEPHRRGEVLSARQERSLFRAYNFSKWRQSEVIRLYQGQKAVPAEVLDELDDLERQSRALNRRLVVANQALVIDIARRHIQNGITLDELASEGMMPLLKAVEKFDYTRGYKFSTYASWAIMKHFARVVPEEGRQIKGLVSYSDEGFEGLMPEAAEVDEEAAFHRSRAVQRALDQLDAREKSILTSRFSLDRKGEPMSLAELGKTLGVSKERVRQIEAKAMEKMQVLLEGEAGRGFGSDRANRQDG